MMKIFTERGKQKHDLVVAMNDTAKDWIEYVDKKFEEVRTGLEMCEERYAKYKRQVKIAHRAHCKWDDQIIKEFKRLTGQDYTIDPPDLDP